MRTAGILLHMTSLPGEYGIGTLGQPAYRFADFLQDAGQSYWQILPVVPTSESHSPYQSPSTFAGNTNLIDLTLLCKQGLLETKECGRFNWGDDPGRVDFELVEKNREMLFRLAFDRGYEKDRELVDSFRVRHKAWLEDYALYMALKKHFHNLPWQAWDEPIKRREPAAMNDYAKLLKAEIDYHVYLQYLFDQQWFSLKNYLNNKGISIIGDLPIYVSSDSTDCWANREIFELDAHLNPAKIAGCPPDAFSETGQLWGNPVYNWEKLKKDDYAWWIARVERAFSIYDMVRFDHFRGFESYYAVDAGQETAAQGKWYPGPGLALFKQMGKALGKLPILAEDLGFLTPPVRELLKDTGFPGMKVLQFAFDSDSDNLYLPHNFTTTNCVVYTGTHDNDTMIGWVASAPEKRMKFCKQYLHLCKKFGYHWQFIRTAYGSIAETAIIPFADFIGTGSEDRMNTPSTVGENWKYRAKAAQFTRQLSGKINRLTILFGRQAVKDESSQTAYDR